VDIYKTSSIERHYSIHYRR